MTRNQEADLGFMRRALRLAERGRGRVNPNPVVGAVVVRAGRVVGEGWHRALGEPHAEAMALERAGERARGATLYTTLEPCAHMGRTPPCVDVVFRSGIRRCVVGIRDPHRIVNGKGLRRLRAAGIRVEMGVLADEVRTQLAGYILTCTRGLPRVTLKLATSLDGRIAPAGGFARRGERRWLTSAAARREAHRLRSAADAVVIGAGTARADDPRLTARGVGARRQPLRVVCDTRLRLPARIRLLQPGTRTIVACGMAAPTRRARALEARGIEVWRLLVKGGGVSPRALLRQLARAGCHDVLIEGGAALATSWLREGVVDRIALFVAPRVLGGDGLAWTEHLRREWSGAFAALGRAGRDVSCLIEREG